MLCNVRIIHVKALNIINKDKIHHVFRLSDMVHFDCRVHCQLVKVFARGIENDIASLNQCTGACMSCAGAI